MLSFKMAIQRQTEAITSYVTISQPMIVWTLHQEVSTFITPSIWATIRGTCVSAWLTESSFLAPSFLLRRAACLATCSSWPCSYQVCAQSPLKGAMGMLGMTYKWSESIPEITMSGMTAESPWVIWVLAVALQTSISDRILQVTCCSLLISRLL